jgi:hypothetical protein
MQTAGHPHQPAAEAGTQEATMGRFLGWTLGVGCALALSAAPAAADTRVSVGVFTPNIGVHVGVGRPVYREPYYRPAYRPPVYRVPVYRDRVYYPDYDPYYDPYYYRPVYRDRVVIVNGGHDNGRHNGWYKDDRRGRGPQRGRDDHRGRRR